MRRWSFLLVFLFASPALAQYRASTNVAVNDPVYRDLACLAAHHLITRYIYSHRPYSRIQIAHMIREAETHDGMDNTYAQLVLDRLRTEFAEELAWLDDPHGSSGAVSLHPVRHIGIDYRYISAASRVARLDNGLGVIDPAIINGFFNHEEGRHLVQGSTLALESSHDAQLTRFAALQIQPRFSITHTQAGIDDADAALQRLYLKAAIGNVELEAGRDQLVWGQGPHGGPLLSDHARPLDLVKLSSVAPFTHPWILRYLGPSRYTLFVANLGPEREHPYSSMVGLNAAYRPHRNVEFGFYHTYIFGGRNGAPALTWYDPLTEFFFIRAPGIRPDSRNTADHRAGANLRWTFPRLRDTTWYFDWVFEDIGRTNIWANIADVSGYLVGLHLPRLDHDGRWDLRVEYRFHPGLLYRHYAFISGYQLNGNTLGDPLGPDGHSVEMTVGHDWAARALRWNGTLTYERRDDNIYGQTVGIGGGPNRVFVTQDNPAEHRVRAVADLLYRHGTPLSISGAAGLEHVRSFNFQPGDNRTHAMVRVGLRYAFGTP